MGVRKGRRKEWEVWKEIRRVRRGIEGVKAIFRTQRSAQPATNQKHEGNFPSPFYVDVTKREIKEPEKVHPLAAWLRVLDCRLLDSA